LHAGGSGERGFTLTELLITATLMIIVLTAVAAIAESTQSASRRDQARATTLATTQAGLSRMTYELRQACYLVPPGTTPAAGTYCGRPSVRPAPTNCSNAGLCIDFIMWTRSCIQRTTTASCAGAPACASPPCVTRGTLRVRYDCSVVDPAGNGTTECVRFTGGACAAPASGTAPSPDCAAPGRTITSCSSAQASGDAVLIRSLLNYNAGSGLDCTSTARPVFGYCTASDNYVATSNDRLSCSGTPSTAAAVTESIYVARRGERSVGLANGMYLQDGAALRNATLDTSP
jgi:type II secretory pathway pseudopilin PulG